MPKKLTHQEFIQKMKDKRPEIEILGEYKNYKSKIECKCNKGHVFQCTPSDLLQGVGCGICNGKVRKTHEQFLKEMREIDETITIIGEYKSDSSKIECICKECHTFNITPNQLLKGQGCRICGIDRRGKAIKLSKEDFISRIKNEDIIIQGEFINTRTKIKVMCKNGHTWMANPNDLMRGTGCLICSGKSNKTHDQFVREVKSMNPSVTIIGTYTKATDKIEVKCSEGHIYQTTPNSLLMGKGCLICCGHAKKTHETFIKEMQEINPDIEILSEYFNCKTKLRCRCLKDNYEWVSNGNSLLAGYGCKKCNSSKGEKIIEGYLTKNNIKYTTQYRINECRQKAPLPFDFALFNNSRLFSLIEYQGIQHYRPIERFGGEKQFKIQQKRDQIKRDFCRTNNIPLIEIPYTIKDIEKFLDEKLNELNINIQLSLTSL